MRVTSRSVALAALLTCSVPTAVACGDEPGADHGEGARPADRTTAPTAPGVTTDHRGSDVTTNPAADATGPGIDRFEASASVGCEAGSDAAVEVSWSAPSASVVRFIVDGFGVGDDQPAVGATEIEVPCDGAIHVVLLTAVGADGFTSVRSEAVLTTARS